MVVPLNRTPSPYMQDEDWAKVKHFTPKEPWGNWRKVQKKLIFGVDALREFAGKKFVIHNAYDQSGHSDGSYHYEGKALDGHFEGMHILDQFIVAMRFDQFNGIGVYLDWDHPGLHLDMRPFSARLMTNSLWLRKNGKYIALTWENLKEALKS